MTDDAIPSGPPSPPPPPPPPGDGGLQFDRAESKGQVVSGPLCAACKRRLDDVYYLAGGQKICGACRDAVARELAGGSKGARVTKAVLLGFLAAVLGGGIWAFISVKSDGTIWGIVAIGLGVLVGYAVRKGSEGRGGRGYQFLAIALTYLGVATGYMGYLVPKAFDHNKTAVAKDKPPTPVGATPSETPAPPEGAGQHDAAPGSPGKLAGGCLVALVALIGLYVASPVLVAVESPITLFFLAIALWEAWKLNRGLLPQFSGPYRLGGSSPGKAAGA